MESMQMELVIPMIIVGNIIKGIAFKKIKTYEWYAKKVDSYNACKDCWMKHLCSGSCFAIKWLENNNTNNPSEYLYKSYDIYWSAIIRLYIQIYPTISDNQNLNFNLKNNICEI